ncbi:baseplate J/gp47 family protein [Candidatus Gottesmanbacteria bacterium]|nr:baseplate J/gp47 family protein [Candidatus Gottesmanbacteria bacterium]
MSFVDKLLPKDKPQEYFLTLKVGVETMAAIVWEVRGSKIAIIGQGNSTIEEKQDLVEAANIAISQAENSLPPDKIVEKVIFGLPVEFIEANKIKQSTLLELKKLTHKLSLTPLGFIELPEALAHFLKTRENSPSSAILLGVGPKNLTLSVLRVGKIYENITHARGENFLQSVEEALKKLISNEVLPSRVLLYDESSNLESLAEELVKHPWHKNGAFLHIPKIEALSKDDVINALVESAAAEIIQTVNADEFKTTEVKEEVPAGAKAEEKEVRRDEEEIKDEAGLLGFHKNKDVLEEAPIEEEEIISVERTPEEIAPPPKKLSGIKLPSVHIPKFHFANFHLPSLGGIRFLPIIIIVIILLALGGVGVYAYYQIPKAEVRLLVGVESMQKEVEIILSANTQTVDSESLTMPAQTIETEVSGEKEAKTTGKKNVGNPARGSVTIFNKTTSGSKTFPKGTILLANNLKFSLDSDVNVASASDTGEGLTYGKTDAKITASVIGPEGNLGGGNNLTFADFPSSSYTAKNNEALSGGTSRSVSVVSKADQDNLLTDLSTELKEKAKTALFEKQGEEEKILDESMEVNVVNKKFDKNIDAETTALKLALTAQIKAQAYRTSDLNELARVILVNNIPPGYEFSPTRTNIKVNDIKEEKDGSYKASSIISASLLPKVPLEKIQRDLAGKSLSDAQDYLRKERSIVGVEMSIDSPFPFGKDKLPLKSQNIALTIAGS